MSTRNSWQQLLCIIIQVSTAGVTYYAMPKFFDVLVPMNMREPQASPLLVPAPAESVAQVLPVDPQSPLDDETPLSVPTVPPEDLTSSFGLSPEIIPPNLNNNISVPKFVTEILKDPSKGIASLAEDMSSLLKDKLPGNAFSGIQANPLDFTALIDSLRKALDSMGQNKDCESGLTVIDHSLYTSKELISSITALHKLREMWKNVNVNSLVHCFVSPGMIPPKINLSPPPKENSNGP